MAAPISHLPSTAPPDLLDAVRGLPVVMTVLAVDGWGDPCSCCDAPADGGPETPHAAVAYVNRPFTVGTLTTTVREPVCETCLRWAVRWELHWRPETVVVRVDVIGGAR